MHASAVLSLAPNTCDSWLPAWPPPLPFVQVLSGPDTGNFIVLFKTPQAATLAAHSAVYPHTGAVEAFKVQPAPSPEDVLWPVGDRRIGGQHCHSMACRFGYAA
jgi:hypothetical protein